MSEMEMEMVKNKPVDKLLITCGKPVDNFSE